MIWTRSANSHTGRRLSSAASKAGQMTASDHALQRSRLFPLPGGGRSLIAAPPSRLLYCRPPGSRFSPRSVRSAATSGPVRKRWHCKVHNGLTLDHVPTAPTAQLPAPSPRGDSLSASCGRVSVRYAAMVCGVQRNGSLDRQTLCRMTDNLRAKAIRALPGPERCSIAAAQSFRCDDRLTR